MSVAENAVRLPESAIALAKIAFHFKIELLGKIAGEIDSCAAQTEAILQRGLTKASFKCRHIAVLEIHLYESAQRQLQFRSALLHVDRQFFVLGGQTFST